MGLTRPKLAQISTTTSAFDDPIIVLNNNASGSISNDKDIGIVFERGGDTNQVLIWDESADEFVLASSNEQGSTSGDVTLISYANLHVNDLIAEGSITMKGNVVLGDAVTDTITFNGEYTFPSADGSANQVLATDGAGNLSFVDVATTLDAVTDNGATTTNAITVGSITAAGLAYPTADGTNGQVLSTNGAGTLSFVDVATTLDAVTDNGATTTNSIEVGGITVSGNIVPSANETYSLGTPTNRFSTLHVAESTVYLGDVALSIVSGELYVDGNPVAGAGDAWPGYDGDYDMSKALAQTTAETPFEEGGEDAFGVVLTLVFDNMDPGGQIITYDLAKEYSSGTETASAEAYLGA
jgi:hypothetical protein